MGKRISEKICLILISIIMQILLFIPNIFVFLLDIVESIIRIFKNTTAFLIKQIEVEVLKTLTNG